MTGFDPGLPTPEMSRVFSAESRVQPEFRFEAALAGASAEAGFVAAGAPAAPLEKLAFTTRLRSFLAAVD